MDLRDPSHLGNAPAVERKMISYISRQSVTIAASVIVAGLVISTDSSCENCLDEDINLVIDDEQTKALFSS